MFLQRCSNTFVASMRYLASVTYVTDRRSQWKLMVDSHTGWAWERQIARNMRVSFNFEATAVICIVCAHCSMQHRAPVKVNNYNCLSQLITSSANVCDFALATWTNSFRSGITDALAPTAPGLSTTLCTIYDFWKGRTFARNKTDATN